jgi:hypothetical protein
MDQERLRRIKNGDLIDVIRVRTAMYTGSRTLTAVYHFLGGYTFFLRTHEIPEPGPLPVDFHDWVAYRLHFPESTSGFKDMILDRVPDEGLALDKFFELLDEHKARQPRIVAVGTSKGWTSETRDRTRSENATEPPEPFALVTYTDDPGFFVKGADGVSPHNFAGGGFCATIDYLWMRKFIGDSNLKIIDQATYDRLVCETNSKRQ